MFLREGEMSDIFDRESLQRLRAIYISHAKSSSSPQIFVFISPRFTRFVLSRAFFDAWKPKRSGYKANMAVKSTRLLPFFVGLSVAVTA